MIRGVIEAAPSAMILVNPEGKITLINAQVEAVFGYARQEVIGQPMEILVPERFRSHHSDYRNSFFADPKVRMLGAGRDLFGQRKDGSHVSIEIGLNPINISGRPFVLASIIDITERKLAEKERARLISITEATTDLVGIADPQGHVLYLNKNGRQMLGISEDEDLSGFHVGKSYPEPASKFVLEEAIPTPYVKGSGRAKVLSLPARAEKSRCRR